jgi:hypothetical protein
MMGLPRSALERILGAAMLLSSSCSSDTAPLDGGAGGGGQPAMVSGGFAGDGGQAGGSCNANGVRDGDEAGIDCGGLACPRCDIGQACASASECPLGFCVDGVCCESACEEMCHACSNAETGAGADGICEPVALGLDPRGDCAAEAPESCGHTGECNGSGACERYPAGTRCDGGHSCDGTRISYGDVCDGSGTCLDGGAGDCFPFACGATQCLTSCATNADCAPGRYCADSVCCETPCTGFCHACSLTKKNFFSPDGTCEPIFFSDPDDECGAAVCYGGACDI